MTTELLKITEENLDYAVKKAAKLLKSGELVGLPTETVYGLAANAYNIEAVKKIFRVKRRPSDNPLIVHVSDFMMLKDVADLTPKAVEMAKVFWPGPLTMVLKKTSKINTLVTCGLDTVAVRMPSHYVARAVIDECDLPLAAPSANLSGLPSTTSAQHVLDDLNGTIPLILDSGNCEIGVESTVISLTDDIPVILRPGIISLEKIRELFPETIYSENIYETVADDKPVASPGMKYKHYSPRSDVIIVKGTLEQFISYVTERAADGVYAMCFDGEQDQIPIPSVSYGKMEDGFSQANRLFMVMRMLDKLGVVRIFVRSPSERDESMAVFNRLLRAAGFRVVTL
jgi:L-threonylcarbamoyladenylate synthase